MKKFTKLFLSCAAVAAVTAAVATSAMAAGEVTADWNQEAKTLKITANYTAEQKTLLILPKGGDRTKISSADDVVQIDQEAGDYFNATVIPTGELKDGTYTVYMGGTGVATPYSADFVVGDGVEILVGDANQDDFVDGDDAVAILQYNVDKYTFEKNGELAADANQDDFVDGDDAVAILKWNVDKIDDDNKLVNTKITVAVK